MTYADWQSQTEDGFFGRRSRELVAVDKAFEAYEKNKTTEKLTVLDDAVAAWKLSKADWNLSKRSGPMWTLTNWLEQELVAKGQLIEGDQTGWTTDQHCYAYAMMDKTPGKDHISGGHACPGAYYGVRPRPGDTPKDKYVQGVLNDAQAQGKNVTLVGNRGVARPVPAKLTGGYYLAAMLAIPEGFHFLRRDEQSGYWTHKNGASSPVLSYIYHDRRQRFLNLTNEVVGEILENAPSFKSLQCGNMTFEAYFKVPDGGIKVGVPHG